MRALKKKDRYLIAFQGLKEGEHCFEFDVNDTFFGLLDYSLIERGALKVFVNLSKTSRHLELEVAIDGYVYVQCDRCLEEYAENITFDGRLFVKFGEERFDEDDEIWVLSKDDNDLDITHYIYESINLSLPYRKVHPDDKNGNITCNPEMLEKLEEYTIEEEKNEEITDPRWDKLKDLLKN